MAQAVLQNAHWPWLRRGFASTRWSLIARAAHAREAETGGLQEICQLYWHPLYCFLRGQGHSGDEAQDHVQSFMEVLIRDKTLLEKADPERGRFRNWLLTLLVRHVASERRRGQARKRGGGIVRVPFDWASAESLRLAGDAEATTPEAAFRRSLAVRLVNKAVESLESQYTARNQEALLRELMPAIEGPLQESSYEEVAARLSMNNGAVRAAVFKLRGRFREALRAAASLALHMPLGPALDAELRDLFG